MKGGCGYFNFYFINIGFGNIYVLHDKLFRYGRKQFKYKRVLDKFIVFVIVEYYIIRLFYS